MTHRWLLGATGPEAYERHLVPPLFEPFAERLVSLAAPAPGERVLDVACGTGIVARRVGARLGAGGRVVGLDANPRMVEVARMDRSVEWLTGDASDLPLPDESFELVLCQQGLQFVADRRAALAELRRVLVPGGRIALSVWRAIERNPGFAALADVLDRHAGPDVGAIMRAPFALGAEDLRAWMRGAGLRDVAVHVDIGRVRFPSARDFALRQAAASPLAGPFAALDDESREALVEDLTEALRPYADGHGVVFPMATHVVTAVRQRLTGNPG